MTKGHLFRKKDIGLLHPISSGTLMHSSTKAAGENGAA